MKRVFPLSFLSAFLAFLPVHAKPGDHRFFHSDYIEYIQGDLPVILSAPHGGSLLPVECPNRVADTLKAVSDQNTEELTLELVAMVFKASGHFPHAVINHLHRIKLDPNRDPADSLEPPFVNDSGKAAWIAYHAFLDSAEAKMEAQYGKGMLFDLHGHQHVLARVELGYLISNFQLRRDDQNLVKLEAASSLGPVAAKSSVSFPELVRGARSFGGYLEGKGIPAVPSPHYPHNDTNPFFSGGTTLRLHCLAANGSIGGMQIELPLAGYRNSQAVRAAWNSLFWGVVRDYMQVHSGLELPALPIGVKPPKSRPGKKPRKPGASGLSSVNGRQSTAKLLILFP